MNISAEYTSRVEVRDGRVYVTRVLSDIKAPFTKWDFLSEGERQTLAAQEFGMPCTKCGQHLATEADFARHFIVSDPTFFNLGYCPNVGNVHEGRKDADAIDWKAVDRAMGMDESELLP